ncbi:MAG TPA: hypothetical protein VK843_18170 [Planctomycetota bacterium]|nr:hypothetical protein [Planctomycetota bacterium]
MLALATGSLLVALLVEAGLRIVAPQPKSWLDIYRTLPPPLYFGLAPSSQALVDTQESRWRVFTDEAGHRIGASPAPASDRPNAVFIGDSFTFGQSVEYEQSFVGLIDAAPDAPASFTNLGVGGYGPSQYRMVLDQVLGEGGRPAAVIVTSFLGNDFHDCMWDKHVLVRDGALTDVTGVRVVLKQNLHSYRLFSRWWHAWNPAPQQIQARQMFEPASWTQPFYVQARAKFSEEFERMAQACRSNSIPFLVVLIPPRETIDHHGQAAGPLQYDLPLAQARASLQELDIPFLDATPNLVAVGADQAFLPIDGHLTARGHQAVRDCIQPSVERLVGGR